MPENAEHIRWKRYEFALLDQRRLPRETTYIDLTGAEDTARAITDMVVRGAPAIGITAAYGMTLAAHAAAQGGQELEGALRNAGAVLRRARPTAVNLAWAVDRMERCFAQAAERGAGAEEIIAVMAAEAEKIHADDIQMNRQMGRFGAELLPERARVLTHCNAGALATGGPGTALGIIRVVNANMTQAVRRLTGEPANVSVDVFWARLRPYLSEAAAGSAVAYTLMLRNNYAEERRFEARLLAPAGWTTDGEFAELKLGAGEKGELELTATAPGTANIRRIVTAEIRIDGVTQGPIAEAVVTVTGGG